MKIRPLPAERAAVRRYVEDLWLPYHRDLSAVVEGHALADDVDLVDREVEFRLDRLGSDGYRAWVAVDGVDGPEIDLGAGDGDLVAFVTTDVDRAAPVFDRPDRLEVGDLYVTGAYRGTGLATRLMARASERADEADCESVALDVDVDNERAIAFYRKLGFEPHRHRMTVPAGELDRRIDRERSD